MDIHGLPFHICILYTHNLFVLHFDFGQFNFPTESCVTKEIINKLPDITDTSKSFGHIMPEAPFLSSSIYHMSYAYHIYTHIVGFLYTLTWIAMIAILKTLVYQVNWANSEATGLSLDEDLLSRTIRIANTNIVLCFCVQKYGLGEFETGRFHIPINIILMYI